MGRTPLPLISALLDCERFASFHTLRVSLMRHKSSIRRTLPFVMSTRRNCITAKGLQPLRFLRSISRQSNY